jgi:hypothetical protein
MTAQTILDATLFVALLYLAGVLYWHYRRVRKR